MTDSTDRSAAEVLAEVKQLLERVEGYYVCGTLDGYGDTCRAFGDDPSGWCGWCCALEALELIDTAAPAPPAPPTLTEEEVERSRDLAAEPPQEEP